VGVIRRDGFVAGVIAGSGGMNRLGWHEGCSGRSARGQPDLRKKTRHIDIPSLPVQYHLKFTHVIRNLFALEGLNFGGTIHGSD
jgi:hypothetical protein